MQENGYSPAKSWMWAVLLQVLLGTSVVGNDSLQMRQWLQELAAPRMHGRGYVRGGMDTAAAYLQTQLRMMGLHPQVQRFSYPVNTFPGKVLVSVNGKRLEPGRDFLVASGSASYTGSSGLVAQGGRSWISKDGRLLMETRDTLTWNVADNQLGLCRVLVKSHALPANPRKVAANIEAKFETGFSASNVYAIIPGTQVPDSMMVFTAHYDHLGMMGNKTMFPGANDNGTGTAVLLALARHIAASPLPYTTVVVFFAGEEAGLKGSHEFVVEETVPLQKIRFLLNIDLAGDGEDGIMVVNALKPAREFRLLQEINEKEGLLPVIKSRDNAPNSDHYYFTVKGVPAFFWYTMGKRKAYHDIDDVAETVPFTKANQLVQLALRFSEQVVHLPRN